MSEEATITPATFTALTGDHKDEEVPVHFNPASLQYSLKNVLRKGRGNSKKQQVSQSTAQLVMELVFDTTDNGQDVRTDTNALLQFMKPDSKKAPPVVKFEWGTFTFQGMLESYKETIDFFAPGGVPLRSTVNVTLSSQDKVFETSAPPPNPQEGQREVPNGPQWDTANNTRAAQDPRTSRTGGAAAAARQGGDERAARSIAAANNQASLRFPSGPTLTVDASVQLGGPVAFASGDAGIGGGISGGFGISAGAGVSAGAGSAVSAETGVGVSAGAGASASIGGGASAGVSASAGAFAGLRAEVSGPSISAKFNADSLIKKNASVNVSTDSGADFSLGGQASIKGSTSLRADVGASASLKARIQFEES